MTRRERFDFILDYFTRNDLPAETELIYKTPFQLLVAVILSAQCTDKRVNLVTPKLFADFPDVYSMSVASPEVIFEYIKSISYPNNKAKHLCGMAKMLVKDFDARIPDQVENLVKLPGVGRKTANVIVSVVFDKPAMAVDTHVFRVAEKLGLTHSAKTPLQAEQQLVKYIPDNLVKKAHHWLILHGRYVCIARNPRCEACKLNKWCKYYLIKHK